MERRFFLKSLLGLATVAVAGAASKMDAAAMPVAPPVKVEPKTEEAVVTSKDLAETNIEKAQYYYRRRYYVRRRYYAPRRRVYFYRPRRRVFIRRFY